MRRGLLVAACLVIGCWSGPTRQGFYACADDGECPPGWSCVGGLCYEEGFDSGVDASGSIDSGPDRPDVPPGSVAVEIVTPTDGTEFNLLGAAGRTADLNDGSETCEARFVVRCTEPGVEVTLHHIESSTELASAPCAAAAVPPPYVGEAVFEVVTLPSVADGASFTIEARQTARGTTATSPVTLSADCEPPQLGIVRPGCGAALPPSADEDPSNPGFQYGTVLESSDGVPLELTIRTDTGSLVFMQKVGGGATTVDLGLIDYGPGAAFELTATTSDQAGNVGAVVCAFTVGCPAGFGDCDGVPDNGCETDTDAEASHCGACDAPCTLSNVSIATCTAGDCGVGTCRANYDDCDTQSANGCERDLDTDEAHCGGCGVECGLHSTCIAAGCGCDAGYLDCGAPLGCETAVSTSDCGGCGAVCGTAESCQPSGRCACGSTTGGIGSGRACGAGEICCGTVCANVNSDEQHCGSCGMPCNAGFTCVAGTCTS